VRLIGPRCPQNQRFTGQRIFLDNTDDCLMPAKKDQAPLDLRYFKQTKIGIP
jgi:hypothetical protein